MASGDGESVDEFENEETREGAAEVADAVEIVSKLSSDEREGLVATYVARRVM